MPFTWDKEIIKESSKDAQFTTEDFERINTEYNNIINNGNR